MFPDFFNMLSPWTWVLLAAIPPAIVALYFLKLKREPLEVPSTYLWHKSIEDLHVNSIWQRMRQNILLFLQLLIVFLAILALLRPSWLGVSSVGTRSIYLIDNSASMSATDVDGSRLEEAKRQVYSLIDSMESSDKAMILSFSETGQVVQEFTNNRQQLRSRLETIAPTNQSTSLLMALQLAAGLANPGRIATEAGDTAVADPQPADVYIFSDGKFPSTQGFSLGYLQPVFIPIGKSDAENVAITIFGARRNEKKKTEMQAFARLQNYGAKSQHVEIELFLDNVSIDNDELEIEANKAKSMTYTLGDVTEDVLRLEVRSKDSLDADNRAYAVIHHPLRGRVLLVTPGNEPLLSALTTDRASALAEVTQVEPAYLSTKEYQKDAVQGAYDLVIFDQCAPQRMPQSNTLFIGRLPHLESWGWKKDAADAEKVVAPQVIDVRQAHPMMQLVELGNVDIAESLQIKPPSGGSPLIDSHLGTICAIGPRDGFEDAVIGFELVGTNDKGERYTNTNWPLRLSFPTFMLNTLEYLGSFRQPTSEQSAKPGETLGLLSSERAEKLTVRLPDGRKEEILRGPRNQYNFNSTGDLGVYEILEGDQVTQRFAVNLFNPQESDIRAVVEGAIQIGYTQVESSAGLEPARKETWRGILLLLLLVLLAEWYIYNRRVYI